MVMLRDVKKEPGSKRGTFFFHCNDGFQYHRNVVKRDAVYFKCVRYERGCCGRALYDRERGFVHTNPHNHGGDLSYPNVKKLRQRILMRCRNLEFISFRRIIAEEGARFPIAVRRQVRLSRMRSAMRRVRYSMFPPPPQTLQELADLLAHPQFRVIAATKDAEDSLYAGNVTAADESYNVIFMSKRMARVGRRLRVLFCDGTFKTLPAIGQLDRASQVFVIIGNWSYTVIPIGWVLMQNRTQDAYEAVLTVLQRLLRGAPGLEKVITDFEVGMRSAFASIFPDIALQGCFFHLVRAFIRYAREECGLTVALRNQRYKVLMKLACALPLLPYEHILPGYALVLRQAWNSGRLVYNRMRPFFRYVHRNWVGPRQKRRWMCVHGSFHRTNNTCESHNNALKKMVGVVHPSIYHFISCLVIMESNAFADVQALIAGETVNGRRKSTSIAVDRRLINLGEALNNPPGPLDDTILNFLSAAAHTFDNVFDDAIA